MKSGIRFSCQNPNYLFISVQSRPIILIQLIGPNRPSLEELVIFLATSPLPSSQTYQFKNDGFVSGRDDGLEAGLLIDAGPDDVLRFGPEGSASREQS